VKVSCQDKQGEQRRKQERAELSEAASVSSVSLHCKASAARENDETKGERKKKITRSQMTRSQRL